LPCLESLRAVPVPLNRVVVVDNASGDDSVRQIRDWAARRGIGYGDSPGDWLVLLQAAENRGYAAGNNIGLDWIAHCGDAGHVWMLNPDTQVEPDALAHMLDRMAEDPSIGTCGAIICEMENRGRVQCYAGGGFLSWAARPYDLGKGALADAPVDHATVERELGYVMGACLLASRKFLSAAGPMDERFFLYFEEIAWQRAAGKRFRPGFAPAAVVYHRRHATAGTQEWWLFGNRLRFALCYQPWSLPTVAATLLFGTAVRAAVRGKWARARLLTSLRFWRTSLTRRASLPVSHS